jgi:hypothetical protein
MKKLIVLAAVFAFTLQNRAVAQSDSPEIKAGLTKLASLLTDHMAEKAYLHFDRPYPCYVAGETIYFKVYVTKGELHEPTTISSVLHVDLIDKNDILMKSLRLQLNNRVAWGDFTLPDTLHKGNYRVRAYTEWMRNDSNPYFYDQFVSVSSVTGVDRVAGAAKSTAAPSLQFFPEGGNMVVDLRSKVGFKAIGGDGLGVNLKGVIIDNENKEVAKINSSHLGMGMFDFIPEEGKTYKAKVTFADGTQSTAALPAAEAKGITLLVNSDDPTKISIEVRANRAYYKENLNKDLNIVVYGAGSIRTIKTKLDNADLGLDLPANSFPTGIVQVTLLAQNGDPMNERLCFVQNPDLLTLSLTTNKPAFAKRENVQLSLNAKNKDGKAANGSFSVAVIDESKILVDEDAEGSILSYLLMTSNLKGYVEKPNYYFAHVNKDTRADLDALLLTQGYRRFTWKELINSTTTMAAAPATFMPEHGIDISGVLKTKTGQPVANCNIAFLAQAGGPVLTQTTDADGRFRFENAVFETGARFILKTLSPAGKNAVLSLDKLPAGPAIAARNPSDDKYNANADILASMQNNQKFGAISESNAAISVISKTEQVTNAKSNGSYRSSNLGGSGHADQVIMGDEIKGANSLSQALNGLAHGVQFANGVPALTSAVVISAGAIVKQAMLVVIDGTTMGAGVSVDQILPSSVETIEILKYANAGVYGVQGGAGVMIITTKQSMGIADAVGKEMSPGIFEVVPNGYYKAKEFYVPAYDAAQAASTLPDTRTTIYWKPDVTPDADGNAVFNFTNADGAGYYRVVVEGMDAKGNLGHQVYRYKVQ